MDTPAFRIHECGANVAKKKHEQEGIAPLRTVGLAQFVVPKLTRSIFDRLLPVGTAHYSWGEISVAR
jgi:hypothetical protein